MSARQPSSPSGESSLPEFTAKAVVAGVFLGLVFGAANAYLGEALTLALLLLVCAFLIRAAGPSRGNPGEPGRVGGAS